MLAQFPAMIAPESDHRVLRQPRAFEFVENAAQLRVHVTDRRVIAVFECPCKVVRDAAGRNTIVVAQFTARQNGVFGRIFRPERIRGKLDTRRLVEVPVFLGRHERQVRFDEADAEPEGLVQLARALTKGGNRHVGHGAIPIGIVGHVRALMRRSVRADAARSLLPGGGPGLGFAALHDGAILFERIGAVRGAPRGPGCGPRRLVVKTAVIHSLPIPCEK